MILKKSLSKNEQEKRDILASLNESLRERANKRMENRANIEEQFLKSAKEINEHLQTIPSEIKNVSFIRKKVKLAQSGSHKF